ncbi:hypothetical protein Cde04nite_34350 [Cellulomonas denverensis]|nr:hypothetical protein Cde04nite_34350 [Cellulomonas denverensis]
MLALAEWRDKHICPLCGWPREVCQDPALSLGGVEVPPPTRCHITTEMRRQQKAFSDLPGANMEGLLWSARVSTSGAGNVSK